MGDHELSEAEIVAIFKNGHIKIIDSEIGEVIVVEDGFDDGSSGDREPSSSPPPLGSLSVELEVEPPQPVDL